MILDGAAEEVHQPTALVVEDDSDLRSAIRSGLELAGWAVSEASTGADAIALAQQDAYDVVVLDLGLPDIDGFEVLRQLKSVAETAWIPVVVVTGRAEGPRAGDLLSAGAQDYLVKPFSNDELATRLVAARRVAVEHRRLNASEAKYRQLVDLAAEGICSFDAEGTVTFVNGAMTAMLGRDQAQIVGQSLFESMDDESRAIMTAQLTARRTDNLVPNEIRFVDPTGQSVWAQLATSPIFGPDGSYKGGVAMMTEVTARRAAERSLRDSEERDLLVKAQLASIVESSEDAITARSLDGTIMSWNAGAERLTGYSAEEMIGTNLSLLAGPGESDFPDLLQRVGHGERFAHFETRRAHKDGRAIDLAVNLSPIRTPPGP